jgi:ATP-dependent Clp protease ATP-binding subunit ClpB
LLDEFEKTNKEVQNLFLQILDEGVFSDMNGKKVNARNIIFIATSNAGASLIWNMVKEGKDPVAQKDQIINEVVNTGVFKPELLNRYDEVIIFHPLTPDNLLQIAKLMLKKLAKRLEQKGINLIVNDYLATKVSQEGANEIFGARPMNRYIQDKIEQVIADKIITGELKPGSKIEFVEPTLGNTTTFSIVIS